MVKFSVGKEDDNDGIGPSRRMPKKPRLSFPDSDQEEEETQHSQEEEEEVEGEEYDDEQEEDNREEQAEEPNLGEQLYCRDDSISVTLTDPEVLDCSICYDSLKIPVFQCENGHIACSSCCIKVGNKCPSCSWPIGYNRCRAIEKVLESIKVPCENTKYGCKEKVSFNDKGDHEDICIFAPSSCPLLACRFMGSFRQLSCHFNTKHLVTVKEFRYNCLFPICMVYNSKFLLLQEEVEGALYILNNRLEALGNVVTISYIAPKSSKIGFSYDLIVKQEDSTLRLQSLRENCSGLVKNPPTRFLLVPRGFYCPSVQLNMELCIRKVSNAVV